MNVFISYVGTRSFQIKDWSP